MLTDVGKYLQAGQLPRDKRWRMLVSCLFQHKRCEAILDLFTAQCSHDLNCNNIDFLMLIFERR